MFKKPRYTRWLPAVLTISFVLGRFIVDQIAEIGLGAFFNLYW